MAVMGLRRTTMDNRTLQTSENRLLLSLFTFFVYVLNRKADKRRFVRHIFANFAKLNEDMSKRHPFYVLAALFALALFPTTLKAGQGDKNFTLVIDAGHGGHDGGAPGSFSNEKDINLSIALELGRLVQQNCSDVKVIFTRKTDVYLPLYERADIANKAKADLFVSIHTNSLPGGGIARGVETYTNGMGQSKANLAVAKRENDVVLLEDNYMQHYNFDPLSAESSIMLEVMQDKYMSRSVEFARLVQQQLSGEGQRPDKGVHQTSLAVCRCSFMPSALIEVGFISTPDEERFLNSDAGVALTARCIYNAFGKYKQLQTGRGEPVLDIPQTAFASEAQAAASSTPTSRTPVPEDTKPDSDAVKNKRSQTENVRTRKSDSRANKTKTKTDTKAKAGAATDNVIPTFKIQILTNPTRLKNGDKRFRGLDVTDSYREGGIYKYTYGSTTDYNEARRSLKKVKEQFPDAFIVAFQGDQKMDVQQAIKLYRSEH
jgi:N-acetylmuramoyl-L-alanine amidase